MPSEEYGIAKPELGAIAKTKEGAIELYDEWASSYDETLASWGYEAPQRTAKLLAGLLSSKAEAHILDAGCGTGMSGEALQAEGIKTVTGTDVSPASIALLKESKPGLYASLGVADLDGEPLPFAQDAFDGVTCVGVLSYIQKYDHVYREWIRVTQAGGHVVFTHWNWDNGDGSKAAAEALEAAGRWKLVHESEPSPYMPKNPDESERAKRIKYIAFQVA